MTFSTENLIVGTCETGMELTQMTGTITAGRPPWWLLQSATPSQGMKSAISRTMLQRPSPPLPQQRLLSKFLATIGPTRQVDCCVSVSSWVIFCVLLLPLAQKRSEDGADCRVLRSRRAKGVGTKLALYSFSRNLPRVLTHLNVLSADSMAMSATAAMLLQGDDVILLAVMVAGEG